MRHLTLVAAALLVTTSFALAQAQPLVNNPQDRMGPKQLNGQCKRFISNTHDETFYIWGECPKQAAAPVVRHTSRRHHG
jgi:hypothetical protein